MNAKIGALRERATGEARVAMTPESAGQLAKLGYGCVVEAGAGVAGDKTASGQLAVSDLDAGQSGFQAVTAEDRRRSRASGVRSTGMLRRTVLTARWTRRSG